MKVSSRRTGEIQSLHRAIDVVESVARAGDIGVSELARMLDMKIPTIHNILRTLTRRHYLVNDEGRYRLGPALTAITTQWDPVASLGPLVQPALKEITNLTRQAASATMLVGSEGRRIGYKSGTDVVTTNAPAWRWENPLTLPTTRLLVAMTRPREWTQFLSSGGSEAEPDWTDSDWLLELQGISVSGVCVSYSRSTNDATGVAVPVWAIGESVVASLGCSSPSYNITDDFLQTMLDAVWSVTVDLSKRLGCHDIPLPKPNKVRSAVADPPIFADS